MSFDPSSVQEFRRALEAATNRAERRRNAEKIEHLIEASRGPRLTPWARFVQDTALLFAGRLTFKRWARAWRRVLEAGVDARLGRPRVHSDAERRRRKAEAQLKWASRPDVRKRRAGQARARRCKLKQALVDG
jgi:hypothetical protein